MFENAKTLINNFKTNNLKAREAMSEPNFYKDCCLKILEI